MNETSIVFSIPRTNPLATSLKQILKGIRIDWYMMKINPRTSQAAFPVESGENKNLSLVVSECYATVIKKEIKLNQNFQN